MTLDQALDKLTDAGLFAVLNRTPPYILGGDESQIAAGIQLFRNSFKIQEVGELYDVSLSATKQRPVDEDMTGLTLDEAVRLVLYRIPPLPLSIEEAVDMLRRAKLTADQARNPDHLIIGGRANHESTPSVKLYEDAFFIAQVGEKVQVATQNFRGKGRAVVKRDGVRVGLLKEIGGGTTFTYDEAYLGQKHARALSPVLPLRKTPYLHLYGLMPFFANLLPEGSLLAAYEQHYCTHDKFQLLTLLGADVAGAVEVFPLEHTQGEFEEDLFPTLRAAVTYILTAYEVEVV